MSDANAYGVIFKQRNNETPVPIPNSVELKVKRYSKSAVGGCKDAIIEATGERGDLYDFLNWLRFKTEISNDRGKRVWWGYLARVEIVDGKVQAVADIDWMSNRVAVAYTDQVLGQSAVGARATTAWKEEADSILEFGTKELLDGRGGTGSILAEAARNRLLEQKKFPTVTFQPNRGGGKELKATLTCRGWWGTLAWKYCPVATRLALAFETLGYVMQTIGCDYNDDQYNVVSLAQSFDVHYGFNLQDIEINVWKIGSPPADLTVAIYSNPDDLTPTTQLASATIPAGSVDIAPVWIRATLSSAYTFSDFTSYFLVVSTSTVDQNNYYVVNLDGNQGYGAGVLRQKVTNWEDGPAADMPFRFYANDIIETTQQIISMITNYGQFLRKIMLDVQSGISTESFRNGDSESRFEVEDLLEMGTDNNRRMFADVNQDRNVRIYEQPPSSEYILLDKNGVFRDLNNAPVAIDECPVGVWVFPSGIVPSTVDMGLLLGLQAFLIEESEYDVETGELDYTPANIDDPWDLGVSRG